MPVEALAREIEAAIAAAAGGRNPSAGSIFNKPGDQYVAYGIKTPDLRRAWKPFRSRLRELPVAERLDLAARLLGAGIGELGHAGIHVLALGRDDLSPRRLSLSAQPTPFWTRSSASQASRSLKSSTASV